MSSFDPLLKNIAKSFETAFGQTPLHERVKDIVAQATTVGRFRDLVHLKQEAGDVLASALQLCNECGWDPSELVLETLRKIESRTEIYKKLGRKLRVGLLGGAFDPVHVGHLQLARDVLESGEVDEVWLMPGFEHLSGKSMAGAESRLEMCRIATKNVRSVLVFDYEIRHEFRGETYHLVKKLLADEAAQTRVDYSLIIGQDNADSFHTWTNADGLERLIPFIVVPRKGCEGPRPNAWYLRPPHRFIEPVARHIETSSSEVRGLLEREDDRAAALLPPGVLEFIQAHQLYQPCAKREPHRRIAVYASTFDPPSRFHRAEIEALREAGFDEVIVYPTGPRPLRGEYEHAAPLHRAAIVSLAFRGMEGVTIDYDDLSTGLFSSPRDLETKYATHGEVWHVVHLDMTEHGQENGSIIQTRWDGGMRLWAESRFAVLGASQMDLLPAALPPHHQFIAVPDRPSSTELRERVYRGESIADSLDVDVAAYIQRHRLFLPNSRQRQATFRVDQPRLRVVYDTRNPKSIAVAREYERYESSTPNLILVLGGDGTMLRAIREHWRLRVPFVGLNTGHLGFLMNERLPHELQDLELVSFTLPMLRVDAKRPDGESTWGLAYTDVWLERAEGQAAWLRVDVDGETRVSKVVGDGMLVSTAAGSSAYARAMGAVPVPIDTPTLTLAGSNIFQPRFWKPMVLSDDSLITLSSLDYSGKRPLRGFIDGSPLGLVQEITVRRSLSASVELAFTKQFDPCARLLRTLFPPGEAIE